MTFSECYIVSIRGFPCKINPIQSLLNQYNRQPLDARRTFAKKILKAVSINAETRTEDEKLSEAGEILGIGKLTPEQASKLRDTLGMFMTMPKSKLAQLLKEDTADADD